jgi:hypothetical protein
MYTFTAVQPEICSHLVTVNTSKLHVCCVGHEEVTIEISCSNTCRCPHPHDGIKCNWATHIMLDICYKSFTIQVRLSKYFSREETSLLLNIHIGINTFYCYTQMIKHYSTLYGWQEHLFIQKLLQQISVYARPTWGDKHKQTWGNNIMATSTFAYRVSHIPSVYIVLHPAKECISISGHGSWKMYYLNRNNKIIK